MPSPSFLQIWGAEPWEVCGYHPQVTWKHSQRYYRVRSAVRMAFWIPLVYLTVCMLLSLGA